MSPPLLSSRQRRRQLNVLRRLMAILDALMDEALRRGTLSKADAVAWRRTLREAADLLGPGYEPDAGSLRPGDFFVSVVAKLHALARLKRLQDKASRPKSPRSYPRSLRRV